jgi:hypothetical protein
MEKMSKFLIWTQIVINLLLMVVLVIAAFDKTMLDVVDVRWWTLFILVNLYSDKLWNDLNKMR